MSKFTIKKRKFTRIFKTMLYSSNFFHLSRSAVYRKQIKYDFKFIFVSHLLVEFSNLNLTLILTLIFNQCIKLTDLLKNKEKYNYLTSETFEIIYIQLITARKRNILN